MTEKTIYLRNRNDYQFVDKTELILRIEPKDNGWSVWFKSNPNTPYTYSRERVRIFSAEGVIEGNVAPVFSPHRGESRQECLHRYLIEFCTSQQESPVEEDTEQEPNKSPFQMVAEGLMQTPIQGVLEAYLSATNKKTKLNTPLLFPFGCNASQRKAVKMALTHQISVIQGPPGTGKTQTILNLLANLLSQGKTLAIVSNNNAAVDNVVEKLEANQLSWLVAQMGNSQRRREFYENGQSKLPRLTLSDNLEAVSEALKKEEKEVARLFEIQEKLQRLRVQHQKTQHEREVFLKEHIDLGEDLVTLSRTLYARRSSKGLVKLKAFIGEHFDPLNWYQLPTRLRYYLMGVHHPNRLIAHGQNAFLALDIALYQRLLEEQQAQIEEYERALENMHGQELLQSYKIHSRCLLDAALQKHIVQHGDMEFNDGDHRRHSSDFLKRYPVVTSSTFSLRASTGSELYDYLIIDESSQVNIPTAALCFALAKNVVIVGDSRQLPHIVSPQSLSTVRPFPEAYDAIQHSILTSVEQIYLSELPTTLLREHYRCHPLII